MYIRSLSFWIALSLMWVGIAAAQDTRQMNATFKTGPIYTPGRWLPTQIRCSNPTDADVSGFITATAESAAGPYELSFPLVVPARSVVIAEMLTTLPPPSQTRGSTDKPEPATTLYWRSADGAELAREPIYAVADSGAMGGGSEATGVPGVSVLYIADTFAQIDADDPSDLPGILGKNVNYRFTLNSLETSRLSRRTMAFDPARLIIIEQAALALIDPTQQQALLDHVRGGATLLIVPQDASVSSTWIGPLLPMDIVGQRESASLASREFPAVKFRSVLAHRVAIARPDAVPVVTTDENTVAAYRSFGFGRIAMIALPINALDIDDRTTSDIWTAIVGSSRLSFHNPASLERDTSPTGTAKSLIGVMPSIVGATAPPWKTAAMISLAYTGAVAVVLVFIGAKRRPFAIAGCVAGGIVVAGAVLGMSSIKSSDEPLMLARLSVVDVHDDFARRDDMITFFGQAPLDGIDYQLPSGATASAILATGKQPPRVTMFPFKVEGVASSTGTFASVWEIKSLDSNVPAVQASLKFGADGATLEVDSQREAALESPRLLFGGSVMPLGQIASGNQSLVVGPRNPTGDFGGGGNMIANEQSKLRTDILSRVETRTDPILGVMRLTLEPRLVAFAADDASEIETSVDVDRRGETLVRVAVDIQPAPVGTEVRVDPSFTQIRRDAAISLPYRAEAGAWSEASQGGPWLVAIAAPSEMGKLDPMQLKLDLDLRATGYQFTIQRGQVQGGKVRESVQGPVVLEWNNTDSVQQATVDLTPEDVDQNGWVWLRINATPTMGDSLIGSLGGGSGTLPNWRMLRFDATLWGTIAAPPQPMVKTWATEAPASPPKPKPKPKSEPKPKAEPKKK